MNVSPLYSGSFLFFLDLVDFSPSFFLGLVNVSLLYSGSFLLDLVNFSLNYVFGFG